jgi:DNA-binding XRE family transcriptional regulator
MNEAEFKELVGSRMAFFRTKLGLKQQVIAEWLGCKQSTICKMEKGTAAPSIYQLHQLARHFQCSLTDLTSTTSVNYVVSIGPRADRLQQG